MVYPSGGAVAMSWAAMLPPAPALFSTTTACPMFSPSFRAMSRAAVSAPPPGAKPTVSVTGRLGKFCPLTTPATVIAAVARIIRTAYFMRILRRTSSPVRGSFGAHVYAAASRTLSVWHRYAVDFDSDRPRRRRPMAQHPKKAHPSPLVPIPGEEKVMAVDRCIMVAALVVAASLAGAPTFAQKAGNDSIRGVVTGPSGPEAGVWVIAETADLPTKFAKIVVTDDQGRYVIPQLPNGKYNVWSRGYGLKDSDKTDATPGNTVNIKGVAATPKEDAEHYPGMYWYSLLKIPAKDQFPGTGSKGNGISENIKTQEAWVDTVKNACQ